MADRPEHRRQSGEVAHPLAQLELLPHGQVQRRHRATLLIDRTLTADAAHLQRIGFLGPRGDDPADEPVQRRPHVTRRRGHPVAHDDRPGLVDDAGRQSVDADIDRQVGRHEATVPCPGPSRRMLR